MVEETLSQNEDVSIRPRRTSHWVSFAVYVLSSVLLLWCDAIVVRRLLINSSKDIPSLSEAQLENHNWKFAMFPVGMFVASYLFAFMRKAEWHSGHYGICFASCFQFCASSSAVLMRRQLPLDWFVATVGTLMALLCFFFGLYGGLKQIKLERTR